MLRRICTLAAALSLAALIAGGAQAQTDIPIEKMKVKMSHVPSFVYAGVYAALDRGYFAKRGLEVELVIVRGGDTTYQVAGGTLEFAGGSPDSAFFNGLQRGLPVVAIGSLALNNDTDSTTPLMVRKDLADSGKVKTVADLRGLKVANLAPGGITEYLTALALKAGGLEIKDVDYITPMGFAQMADALKTKTIDAAVLAEPFGTLSEKNNIAVRLNRKHDLGEQVLFIKTNRDFAQKHPNVVVNFLIAYLMGSRDFAGNAFLKPENVALLEKYTRASAEVIKAAPVPVLPADGRFNMDSIMAQQRFHMGRGKLTYKEPIETGKFIDQSYVRRALTFLGPHKP